MVLVFPEILVHIQVNVSSQSLSLVAAHWMVQGNFGPGCLHLQDSDVISLRGSPSIRSFQSERGDFSGGPVVKNLPTNAGDTGLIPGLGTKTPHATGKLSPHTTTTDPACDSY